MFRRNTFPPGAYIGAKHNMGRHAGPGRVTVYRLQLFTPNITLRGLIKTLTWSKYNHTREVCCWKLYSCSDMDVS